MEASIIIVTYNAMQYIANCLNCLALELKNGNEIILIDNASTDGSGEYIQQHHPQVSLVRNAFNTGFAAACNQGAALARGDFLVFLNQDTRVCPGWLSGLLAPFSRDASIGLVTSKILLMSRPGQVHTCGQDIHYSGLVFARGLLRPAGDYLQGEPVSAISGASFAIPRQLWRRLGGFDEGYFMYYEETDLSWRAWLAGFTSYVAPESLVVHDYRLKPSPAALYYSARNRWVLLLKHWRLSTLLLLSPGLLLAELVDWGLMLFYGWKGFSAKLRGIGWLIRNFGALASRRRACQAARIQPDWFLLRRCTAGLAPVNLNGGPLGKAILSVLDPILRLNYRAALALARRLNI